MLEVGKESYLVIDAVLFLVPHRVSLLIIALSNLNLILIEKGRLN